MRSCATSPFWLLCFKCRLLLICQRESISGTGSPDEIDSDWLYDLAWYNCVSMCNQTSLGLCMIEMDSAVQRVGLCIYFTSYTCDYFLIEDGQWRFWWTYVYMRRLIFGKSSVDEWLASGIGNRAFHVRSPVATVMVGRPWTRHIT